MTLLGVLGLALPAGAPAQVYDDGPAGKEYAIPLEEARDKGKAKGGGSGGETSSDRFGAGISSQPTDADSATSEGGSTEASGKKKGPRSDREDGAEDEAVAPAPASTGGSGGGGVEDNSAALLTGGIALAVLLIGGAVALMTRRTATDDV